MARLDQTDAALDSVASAKEIEALYVQNAAGARYDGQRLTLSGVGQTTLTFSDRPRPRGGPRAHHRVRGRLGRRRGQLRGRPAQRGALLVRGCALNDVVVILSEPRLAGTELSYAVSITDGELLPASSESSLFIDPVGRPLSPVSFAGARRRGERRERRRMG